MNLLLLSGESIRNKAWIHDVQKTLTPLFDKEIVVEYLHWASGEKRIDITHELAALQAAVKELDGGYVVFAKSIGTVLAVKALAASWLKPSKVMFCGIPVKYILPEYPNYADDLIASGVSTLVLQNSDDPAGSYQDVVDCLKPQDNPNIDVIDLPGDTHSYEDLNDLRSRAQAFFS